MKSLDALREHHLAAARVQAGEVLEAARRQASEMVSKGKADAAAIAEMARHDGEAAAALDTDRAWTTARRRARSLILAAQSDAYHELRSRIAAAVRQDPRYPLTLERLGFEAQRQLGPGALVEIDRQGDRGVTATRKDRRVEWSLSAIVDAALDEIGPNLAELWR